jgi:hypothetical protein
MQECHCAMSAHITSLSEKGEVGVKTSGPRYSPGGEIQKGTIACNESIEGEEDAYAPCDARPA